MPEIATKTCDNEDGPEGAINTIRSLTHSTDLSREGLGVEPTQIKPIKHPQWQGPVEMYQRRAQQKYILAHDETFMIWAWITTTCETDMCLRVECMNLHKPVRIAYPAGVCVYCGEPAGTMDHLLPKAWTGKTQRGGVAIVPACAHCNSTINNSFAVSIRERRAVCHQRLRKNNWNLLRSPDRTEAEIAEHGHVLANSMREWQAKKQRMLRRLAWPIDPDYDRRAFDYSGIADAERLGLI